MIHPLLLITFAAFLGSGLYVFQTKEAVAKLDRELREIRRETEAERGRTQTLSAEWARLNDQDRLRQMAASHLRHLQPMEPVQFQRLEDALRRMPQIVAFAPQPSGFRPRADAPSAPGDVIIVTVPREQRVRIAEAALRPPAVAAAPPVPALAPDHANPAPVAAPGLLAPTAPVAAAAPVAATAPFTTMAPVLPSVVAAAAPRAPQRPTSRPEVAALPPIAGPASRAGREYAQGNIPTPIAAPPAALRTALHVQPMQGGSMLGGGAGSLPPPVPFNR